MTMMIHRVPISRPIQENADDLYWAGVYQHRNRRLSYQREQQQQRRHAQDAVEGINHRTTTHTESSTTDPSHDDKYYAPVPVSNCYDIMYTGTIYMGTPYQSFNVQMDTSTSTSWIPSATKCDHTCRNLPFKMYNSTASTTYNATLSSTQQQPFHEIYPNLQYAELSGTFVSDTLHLGIGTDIPNYIFAELTTYDYQMKCSGDGGRFGLGLASSTSPLWQSALTAWPQPVFGIYLNKDNDYLNHGTFPEDQHGSEITFGGINSIHYNDCLQWHNPSAVAGSDNAWNVGLHHISVGTAKDDGTYDSVIDMNGNVKFDTSQSGLVGHPDIIGQITSALGLTCYHVGEDDDGLFRTDCGNLNGFDVASIDCGTRIQPVHFVLEEGNGMTYTLTHDDLVKSVDVEMIGQMCMISISSDPEAIRNRFTFGTVFFHRYYVAFNVNTKAIGLSGSVRSHPQQDFDTSINETTSYKRCEVDYSMDIAYYLNELHLLPGGNNNSDKTSSDATTTTIPMNGWRTTAMSPLIARTMAMSFVTIVLFVAAVVTCRRCCRHRYYKRADQNDGSSSTTTIRGGGSIPKIAVNNETELPDLI